MRLSFPPAGLLLERGPNGEYVLTRNESVLGTYKSERSAVAQFNKVRQELEIEMPPAVLSEAQAKEAFQRAVNDGLLGHNSVRPPPKKVSKSRTYG